MRVDQDRLNACWKSLVVSVSTKEKLTADGDVNLHITDENIDWD